MRGMTKMGGLVRYVVGLDLGTSSLKAVLLDERGIIAGSATRSYAIQSPHAGWAEQNPEHWWQACRGAITTLLRETAITGESVVALAVGGQMHGTVLLDAGGNVLRPAIIWPDSRAIAEARDAEASLAQQGLLHTLGGGISPGFMLASLPWCRAHEPELWTRVATALLPKDYLRYRLTGGLASDASDASAIPAIDLTTGTWSEETFAALDLPMRLMPPLLNAAERAGAITAGAAAQCGLRPGTPVLCGGSDQAMAAIGSGLLYPGSLLVSISTGGVLVAPVDAPVVVVEQGLRTVCHALPATSEKVAGAPERKREEPGVFRGGYLAHSATLGAGLSAHWLREILYQDQGEGRDIRLVADAAQAPAGSGGLLFLPYLAGERSPLLDSKASGAFVGFRLNHHRPHLARAALEGIALSLRHALEPLQGAGVSTQRVIVAGGLAQSTLMRQILAAVLETPLLPLASAEQSAFGAALLAAVHAGFFSSLDEACGRAVHYEPAVEPVAQQVPFYRELYIHYRELYPALKDAMHALAADRR
jgi:xylulokinase